ATGGRPRPSVIRRLVKVGILVVLLVVGYVAVTFVQVWQASRRDSLRPAQAIIVLGAAQYNGRPSAVLKARLDHAAALYEAKLAPDKATFGHLSHETVAVAVGRVIGFRRLVDLDARVRQAAGSR